MTALEEILGSHEVLLPHSDRGPLDSSFSESHVRQSKGEALVRRCSTPKIIVIELEWIL